MVVYSDGFSEAMNAAGDMFGGERLAATLARAAGDATRQGEAILADVRAFVGEERQSDDMCLLCIGREAGRSSE